MVLLVTTPIILSALETLPQSSRDELNLPHSPILDAPISHLQLISLARRLSGIEEGQKLETGNEEVEVDQPQAKTAPTYTLNSLLRGTKVYVPPPPSKPEPSPEFLALKARLQAATEEDAYRRLLSSPRPSSHGPSTIFSTSSAIAALHRPDDADGDADDSTDPLTPSLVLNIFLSVLLCGFSTYWALIHFQTPTLLRFSSAKTVVPTAEPAFVLIAIFVGLLVGVAEAVVYAAYLRKVAKARARERAVKEQKDMGLMDPSVELNSKGETQKDGNEGEPQEIWGRGVNGGVRRRARERWKEGNEFEKDAD